MIYNAETTSDEVMENLGHLADGKFVVVTGANCGLGLETARSLAKYGSNVVVACRSECGAFVAIESIKAETSEAKVSFIQLDLGSFASIRKFVEAYKASGNPLHLLINNAGVMACPKSYTSDGLEMQFGVNHIGHFLLTTLLLNLLKQSGTPTSPSRIINLSSRAHYRLAPAEGIRLDDLLGENHYEPWERYGASKLANVLFTQELQRRFEVEGSNVLAVSLHPGAIPDSDLARHLPKDFMKNMVSGASQMPGPAVVTTYKNIKQGTSTTLLTALDPAVVPGTYYAGCQVHTELLHPKLKDLELQKRLWEISEQLVAV